MNTKVHGTEMKAQEGAFSDSEDKQAEKVTVQIGDECHGIGKNTGKKYMNVEFIGESFQGFRVQRKERAIYTLCKKVIPLTKLEKALK